MHFFRYSCLSLLLDQNTVATVQEPPSPRLVRTQTLAAVSDALYAAPAVHSAGTFYRRRNKSTYFYQFTHPTRNGLYPQVLLTTATNSFIQKGTDSTFRYSYPLLPIHSSNKERALPSGTPIPTSTNSLIQQETGSTLRYSNPLLPIHSSNKERTLYSVQYSYIPTYTTKYSIEKGLSS